MGFFESFFGAVLEPVGNAAKCRSGFASSFGFVFQPPRQPGYTVQQGAGGKLKLGPGKLGGRKMPDGDVVRLKTACDSTIVAVFIPYKPDFKPAKQTTSTSYSMAASPFPETIRRPTILMSHGTAVDLGRLIPFYSEVAKDLQCNLCAYDYTGYGHSSGRPSVADTIADVDAVFAWLLRRGLQRQDVILYGQSLGSGPTLDLAAREESIAGVVLHAAFASGLRQVRPGGRYFPSWFDIFPNSERIQQVEAPVCILHGTRDYVVDIEAGRHLHRLAKRPAAPYWAENCHHENVEMSAQYIPHLRRFLQGIFGAKYGS